MMPHTSDLATCSADNMMCCCLAFGSAVRRDMGTG